MKIIIKKNGPYMVIGSVPLKEKIITSNGNSYEWKEGKTYPLKEEYYLCRCGKTSTPPFCDGSHLKEKFKGDETASKEKYEKEQVYLKGQHLI